MPALLSFLITTKGEKMCQQNFGALSKGEPFYTTLSKGESTNNREIDDMKTYLIIDLLTINCHYQKGGDC